MVATANFVVLNKVVDLDLGRANIYYFPGKKRPLECALEKHLPNHLL